MKALLLLNILLISLQLSSPFFLKRRRRAPQPVPVNCLLSDWETDVECTKPCGPDGVEVQRRRIIIEARNGGTPCSSLTQEQTVACNRECHNGGVLSTDRCDCPTGWTGECCKDDVDECAATPSPCSHTCVNEAGSFSCQCEDNYTLDTDNRNCVDLKECQKVPPPCAHRCKELLGGYECYCNEGYQLDSDGINCNDIDECKTGSMCQYKCINTPGDYECECENGYFRNADLKTCTDVDECAVNNGGCQQECENTVGGHRCKCGQGYILAEDSTVCKDIDECEVYGSTTLCEQLCGNTPGSYICTCVNPYKLNSDMRTCSCEGNEADCEEFEAQRGSGTDKDTVYNWIIGVLILVCLILFLVLALMCYRRGYYKLLVPKPPPISTIPRHNNAIFSPNIDEDEASGIYEDPECLYEELPDPPDYMEMTEAECKSVEREEGAEENHYVENDYQTNTTPGPSASPRDSTYVDSDTARVAPRDTPRDTPHVRTPDEGGYSTRVEAKGFDHEEDAYENNPPCYDNI